ncbi:MAG: radical SAM protein [Promethearchaeota archaeon]
MPIPGKIEKIRVSIGSASKLGLRNIKMDVQTTNCYLLTYNSEGCNANCAFCPQSKYTFTRLKKLPDSQEFLSRISWPVFSFQRVLTAFKNKFSSFSSENGGFQRICLQSLNYRGFENDVMDILKEIKHTTTIPISVAIPPVSIADISSIKQSGAERICFALDSPTETLFDIIKGKKNSGPYRWDEHLKLLNTAVEIFGNRFVSTHLMIGLGESESEALNFILRMKELGVITGLFAFFPIKNTKFENRERPTIINFRKIQLGKYLIDTGRKNVEDFTFNNNRELISFNITQDTLRKAINLNFPFQTSGCPGCNRPYYTSSPSPRKEQYNFPRKLTEPEKERIYYELVNYCLKG